MCLLIFSEVSSPHCVEVMIIYCLLGLPEQLAEFTTILCTWLIVGDFNL